jgi:hypothetical protein
MQLTQELPKLVKPQISRRLPLQAHVNMHQIEEGHHVQSVLVAKEALQKPHRHLQLLLTAVKNFVLINDYLEEEQEDEKLGPQRMWGKLHQKCQG